MARPGWFRPSSLLAFLRREWPLLTAIAAGLWIRFYQIEAQIVADDEWHAIFAALNESYDSILTHFNLVDRSIPQTLFYKLIADRAGLSEMWVRAPVLSSGCLSLIVFPLLARS